MQAARESWPDRRLVMIYQPHRYTRTRDLFADFGQVLSQPDKLMLLDVYSAGEERIVGADGMLYIQRARIAALALERRLPTMFIWREGVESGGLMSYGPNLLAMFYRTGYYVDKIIKGAKPEDLPVEEPTKFDMVINGKTAKALGLTIPQSLLLFADEVIE